MTDDPSSWCTKAVLYVAFRLQSHKRSSSIASRLPSCLMIIARDLVVKQIRSVMTLEQLILDLPDSVFINLVSTPVLPPALAHLEIRCHGLEVSAVALAAIGKVRVCLLRSFVLCVSPEVNAAFERHLCDDVPEGFKLQFGTGPFMLL